MSFDVIIEDLRTGAAELDTAVDPFAGYALGAPTPDSDSIGHVELAAWLVSVLEQADKAGQALHDGAGALAEQLRTAALEYEQSDDRAQQRFVPATGGAQP